MWQFGAVDWTLASIARLNNIKLNFRMWMVAHPWHTRQSGANLTFHLFRICYTNASASWEVEEDIVFFNRSIHLCVLAKRSFKPLNHAGEVSNQTDQHKYTCYFTSLTF